jgi:hypothetical protein
VLNAEIESAAEFAAAARGWLTGTMAEVFSGLRAGMPAGQPAGRKPGHVVGTLTVNRKHPAYGQDLDYSDRTWARLLGELDGYPLAVSADLGLAGDHDEPLTAPASVSAERDSRSPQWASFLFTAPAGGMAADRGRPGTAPSASATSGCHLSSCVTRPYPMAGTRESSADKPLLRSFPMNVTTHGFFSMLCDIHGKRGAGPSRPEGRSVTADAHGTAFRVGRNGMLPPRSGRPAGGLPGVYWSGSPRVVWDRESTYGLAPVRAFVSPAASYPVSAGDPPAAGSV